MLRSFHPPSAYVRYRDGMWIPSRKRVYLYWFKFLQEAERSGTRPVDWSRYAAWGGRDDVMNSKFDDWWGRNWKRCFGTSSREGSPLFSLSTQQPKADAFRVALLVYQHRHLEQATLMADAVVRIEKSKGRPAPSSMIGDDKQIVQSMTGRYLRRAQEIIRHVSTGSFP